MLLFPMGGTHSLLSYVLHFTQLSGKLLPKEQPRTSEISEGYTEVFANLTNIYARSILTIEKSQDFI